MVGSEFIDLFKKVQQGTVTTLEDFSDQLNLFSVLILLLSTLVVTAKQYLFNSISCYIPVEPSGKDFSKFVTDYCWVTGTIPLRPNERMPINIQWEDYIRMRKITLKSRSVLIIFCFSNGFIVTMVPDLLLQSFNDLYKTNLGNPVDFAERANLITVIILLVLSGIIAAKQYLFNAMSCYIAITPTGENFDAYLTDYCWVHGTIPLRPGESLPQTEYEWDSYDRTRRI
ncbi:Innexin inx2, partial [Cichlidogyrus casuarinus]